jgi:hypothetical protein
MYNLEHAINECIVEKNKAKNPKDTYFRNHEFYKECWDALNKWIESRLKKNKVCAMDLFASIRISRNIDDIDRVPTQPPSLHLTGSFEAMEAACVDVGLSSS